MSMNIHITIKSANAKVGPIPVSTTSAKTCPTDCPFNHENEGGCYAESGPLALHWRKVTAGERGTDLKGFCDTIRKLPEGQLWRHNQAGDLPGDGHELDVAACTLIADANEGRRGFTYTHYNPAQGMNAAVIRQMNLQGFTVNLSGNNPTHADTLADMDCGPVVTVMPTDAPKVSRTPAGRKIVTCPAVTSDKVTCSSCGLCAKRNRAYIIGFPAHGTGKAKASRVASAA